MQNKTFRDHALYLNDIQDAITNIENDITNIDISTLSENGTVSRSIVFSLLVIGEAVNKIPKEILQKYSEIPWAEVIGLRNMLVHEYWEIDEDILKVIITEDLPSLKLVVEKILSEMTNTPN